MPLTAALVGTEVGRIRPTCDARWLMAYAAGIPDERPELYDTLGTLAMHPLFPVAPEWELITSFPSTPPEMTAAEARRGVHSAHDLILERGVRAGETLDIVASVVDVDRRPSGAEQRMLFTATDVDGSLVWRTMLTSVFRGVELVGEPASVDVGWPGAPAPSGHVEPAHNTTSHVRAVDAHVYTECARIWNPIHTDIAVARAAGLDDLILHGTATLARAVSTVCTMAGVGLHDVRRVIGSFRAMVALDSTITIRSAAAAGDVIPFDVLTEAGRPAISDGSVSLHG